MLYFIQGLPTELHRRYYLALLAWLPVSALAQSIPPDSAAIPHRHIVSIAPVELFYKTQLGYEHRLSQRSSLGALGTYRYGPTERYKGWQATGYYRLFFARHFPTGFYFEAQASVFNFQQEAHLYNPKTYEYHSLEYRGVGGGGGFGFGYRSYVLRKATNGRLLGNALVGARFQKRPQADYNTSIYRPELSFVGDSDAFDWHMGFSPGSIIHGILSLDYQF